MKNQIVHKCKGNRYTSLGDNGKTVEMQQIFCQERRVAMPEGHTSSYSDKDVNCKQCIDVLAKHHTEQALLLGDKIRSGNLKDSSSVKFVGPKHRDGFANKIKIDPEILERTRLGG